MILSKCRRAIIEYSPLTDTDESGAAVLKDSYMVYIWENGEEVYDYMQDDLSMAKRCAEGFGISEWEDDYFTSGRYKNDPIIKISGRFEESKHLNKDRRLFFRKGFCEERIYAKIGGHNVDCALLIDRDLEIIPGEEYEFEYVLIGSPDRIPHIEAGMMVESFGFRLYEAQGTVKEVRNFKTSASAS